MNGVKVVVLSQGFPRHDNDHHARFIADHAASLAAAGARVTVVCPSAPGLAARDRWDGVSVTRFRYAPRRFEVLAYTGAMHRAARGPRAVLLPLLAVGFLVAACREARNADVVHAHWWAPSGLVGVVAGRLVGVPVVVHVHGTDAAIAQRGLMRALARRVLRRADAVVAASSSLAAWVRDTAGIDALVAPMPLRPEAFVAPTAAPVDGPVLAVGRLVAEKGFDVLIEAAPHLGRPVVIVGDGPDRAALEALAVAEGADVHFVGAVPPAEVAAWYRKASIVTVPSRREGFGLVAAEALAAGRAVVASDVGGLPEIVTPGVSGLLVPPGDASALAAAVRTVDPALGRHGPAAVASLTGPAIAALNLGVYERVRGERRALAPVLARVGAVVFTLAAVAYLVAALAGQWDEARRLEVSWSPAPAAAAAASVLAADLALAWAWGDLVRSAGGGLGWRGAMRVFWTGQLGRYLPTGLGSVPARIVAGVRAGVARGVMVATTAAEPLVVVVVCLALASVLTGVLAVALVPLALGASAAIAAAVARAPARAALRFALAQAAQVATRGLGFAAMLQLFDPIATPSPARVVGATGLAYFLGAVAVFAPGGIGVREAALAGSLAQVTGPTAVAAAAVAWRFLELVVEVPLLLWARTLDRRAGET